MEQQKQVQLIDVLNEQIEQGVNFDTGKVLKVPNERFVDPDIAEKEWENLFQNTPQVVGLSADLPESGSAFTVAHLGAPILCTRDRDGGFHAFLNVCRHRGHILVEEKRIRKGLISCPFHAWSYDLTGRLVSIPKEEQFGVIDKSCHGLIELAAEELHGLLIVMPNPDLDFNAEEFLGPLAAELAPWKLGEAKYVSDVIWETDCNWKSAVDTFGETYHFSVLHKETVAKSFFGNHAQYERYGNHHLMFFANFELKDVVQETKDNWRIVRAGIPVYHFHPNIQLAFIRGAVVLIRIYPLCDDPSRSLSSVTYYYHNDRLADVGQEVDQADATIELAKLFGEVIQGEDYPAAERSFRGMAANPTGYSILGRNEGNVQHFHEVWAQAMNMPALEEISGN